MPIVLSVDHPNNAPIRLQAVAGLAERRHHVVIVPAVPLLVEHAEIEQYRTELCGKPDEAVAIVHPVAYRDAHCASLSFAFRGPLNATAAYLLH